MKNFKNIFLLFFLFANILKSSFSQNDSLQNKKSVIFLRLGTVSAFVEAPLIYSIDYDRIIFSKNKLKFSTSLGVSFGPWSYGIPLNLNLLIGRKICWESGIGFTFIDRISEHYKQYLYLSFNPIGFRYNSKRKFGKCFAFNF